MATKRRRGNTWHYTIRRKDVLEKPLYLSFEDEAEGDEYVRRVEALLDRGVVPEEFQQKREVQALLREGVRRYLAAQHVSSDDRDLLEVVLARLPRELSLSAITFTWATSWVTSLKREQNLSPSTLRKHVGALARALDWLAAHGDIPFNPLRMLPKGYATYTPDDALAVERIEGKVKGDVERDRRLEEGEEPAIRGILAGEKPEGRQRALELRDGPALRLLFDMALESAMRLREMFTLSVEQVDLPRRTIFLEKTKNGHKRQVPITSVLGSELVTYLGGLEGVERLFPWWDGNLSKESLERTTSRLSRQFARIFDAAGCEDLRFHDLRHEATSRLFERTTLSDTEIMKITGHRSVTMLKRYANLRASNLADRLW
jgi:integrase